jgi:hypothetical protein
MELRIPNGLAFSCRKTPERSAWLTRLPYVVRKLEELWSLRLSGLLRRLWRSPATPHPFRSLASLTEYWTNETLTQIEHCPDAGLVREGLHLFAELPRNTTR